MKCDLKVLLKKGQCMLKAMASFRTTISSGKIQTLVDCIRLKDKASLLKFSNNQTYLQTVYQQHNCIYVMLYNEI